MQTLLFTAGLLLSACLLFSPYSANATPAEVTTGMLVLSTPVTHSDWMLHDGVEWGTTGVQHMLDMCKATGWSRVYWRALDGGRALYRSRLLDPQGKWDTDSYWNPATDKDRQLFTTYNPGMTTESRRTLLQKLERYDYSEFDTLDEAVRYGHQIGLQVHAWITINEDDHGWGLCSRFARTHPDMRWRKRDGTTYHSQMSFAFPEVMDYKLAIIREILQQYAVDGIFLDWVRTGDVRDNPQTDKDGVADHGYEEPLLRAFRDRYGVDACSLPNNDDRWVRLRAESHTRFMREVRKLCRAHTPALPVTVLVAHPSCFRGMQDRIAGNLQGLLLDVPTWAHEDLIDGVVAAGYYLPPGSAETAVAALRVETGGKVETWLYQWVPENPEQFLDGLSLARRLGTNQILYWEGDYIETRANRRGIQQVMRSQHK